MKRLPKIFAILTIGLMLSSVSYAGSDASPGKATTIEKNVCPVYSCEAINFVAVDLYAITDVVQPVTAEKMMIVEKEAILVNENIPAILRDNRRRVDKNVFSNSYKKVISPGQTSKPFKTAKFEDTHRRLCK